MSSNEIVKIVSEELALNNSDLQKESSPLCDGGEDILKILTTVLSGTFKTFR